MQLLPKSYEMNCLKRNTTPRVQKNIFKKSTNLILLCDVIVCYFPSKTHSTTSSHALNTRNIHHILWCSRAAKICQGIAWAPGKVKLTRYQIHGWVPALSTAFSTQVTNKVRSIPIPEKQQRRLNTHEPIHKWGKHTHICNVCIFLWGAGKKASQQGSLTSLRCNLSNSGNFTIFIIFVVC